MAPPGFCESLPARDVQFPTPPIGEYKLYRVGLYRKQREYIQSRRGKAGGVVHVPAGTALTLKIYVSGTQRLSCLEKLQPNAIQMLDLRDSDIKDADLKHVAALTGLVKLDISDTDITDAGAKIISTMKNLYVLTMHGTYLSAAGLEYLVRMPHLVELNIAGNHNVDDKGAAKIARMKNLQGLDISLTNIKEPGVKEIVSDLRNLTMLKMDRIRFTNQALKVIGSMKPLRKLSMTGSKVTDGCVPYLVKCKNLEDLDVGGTEITDVGLQQLRRGLPHCGVSRSGDKFPGL